MRVILFQDRFATLVRIGQKKQTIRKKARCMPGEELSLRKWTGKPYRSKQETLLITICRAVLPVFIEEETSPAPEKEALARADGFESFAEMLGWFKKTHGLPFSGEMVIWD